MGRKLTLKEIIELYENDNRKILGIESKPVGNNGKYKTFVKYKCLIDGYEGSMELSNMKVGQGCPKCGGSLKYTLEEVKIKLKDINPNIEILSTEYINAKTKLKCKCLIDNNIWFATWESLSVKKGCPKCSANRASNFKSTPNGNSVMDLRPDLVKYFLNQDDAKNHSIGSNKKVKLKCINCGKEKQMRVNTLSRNGFSCIHCSDKGVSVPEKFGINLLKQLDVEFETQKVFKWAKNKRYDMFFILNNEYFLCEIMGMQHYKSKEGYYSESLTDIQENDKLKYTLAIQNGIKPENYIIIDTRHSEFNYIKENYIKGFNSHFDLSNIDWDNIWLNSQKSIMVEVCKYWNYGKKEKDTTHNLAEIFNIDVTTVVRYLKKGVKLGLCNYNPKEEMSKRGYKSGKLSSKIVYQYTISGNFIKQWESAIEIDRELGISYKNISLCCNGKRKSSGGFIWSHIPLEI